MLQMQCIQVFTINAVQYRQAPGAADIFDQLIWHSQSEGKIRETKRYTLYRRTLTQYVFAVIVCSENISL